MPGEKIDNKVLSKKYCTNVVKLIRAWKKGMTDEEIAFATGIDLIKLQHIKNDIELAHRRLRLARKRGDQSDNRKQTAVQRHFFFNPFI